MKRDYYLYRLGWLDRADRVEEWRMSIFCVTFCPIFLLEESPGSRVSSLNLTKNEIDVYYGHHGQVREAADLVQVTSEL